LEDERVDDEDFRRVWLPDDRVLEPLLLRDAGGEDVRVAMLMRVSDRPTSLTPHTPGVWPGPPTTSGPGASLPGGRRPRGAGLRTSHL